MERDDGLYELAIHCKECKAIGPISRPVADPAEGEADAKMRWNNRDSPLPPIEESTPESGNGHTLIIPENRLILPGSSPI